MEGVFKQAITARECIVFTPQDRPIGQNKALEQPEVVFSDRVADVNGPARDGAGGSMELGAWVSGLEHVPIRVDEVAHPHAVVGTVHHVTPL